MITPKIQWPKEWAESEGWPVTCAGERPLTGETRCWGSLEFMLRRHQASRLCDRVERLGGPAPRNLHRSLTTFRVAALAHYEAWGRRPTIGASGEWRRWEAWLRKNHNTTVCQQCDVMGLPALRNLEDPGQDLEGAVRTYVEQHGKRPTMKTSPYWRKEDAWLRKQESSLDAFCTKLGFLGRDRGKTMGKARKAVRAHYKSTGERPHSGAGEGWLRWNSWLRSQGTSLAKLCDEEGMPRRPDGPRARAA